jgi:crossover junction endodeoxyribonuclease RuvC
MRQETVEPKTLRVLGVDPGTRCVGYGIIDLTGARQARLIDCDVLRLESGPAAARLESIFRHMSAQMERYRPRVLAIEDVFHGKNFKSVLKIGEARGVIILAAQMAGLEIGEYSPRLIKKSVTGNGNADKSQVQRMVTRILGRDDLLEPEDISDAVAVAFCHGRRAWTDRLLGGDGLRSAAEARRQGNSASPSRGRRSASRQRLDERIRAARSSGTGRSRATTKDEALVRRLIRAGKAVEVSTRRRRGRPSSE